MFPYAALFLLPLGWAATRRFAPEHERAAAGLLAFVLILFVGLRREVGGDWNAYLVMYERARAMPVAEALIMGDPAYMGLAALAGGLGLGAGMVNLACAALAMVPLVRLCRRQPSPPLALAVALPVLVAVVAMHTTRQSVAIGLAIAALLAFTGGRHSRGALLLLLASVFHWTALVLAPLGVLLWSGWRPRGLTMAAGWTLVWSACAAALLEMGAAAEGEVAAGALYRLAPSLLAAGIFIGFGRRLGLTDGERVAAAYLSGLAIFCSALVPVHSLAADRLGLYAIVLQILLLPRAPALLEPLRLRIAATAALVVLSAAMFLVWFRSSSYSPCMVPYRTYFSDSTPLLRGTAELPRPKCTRIVAAPAPGASGR